MAGAITGDGNPVQFPGMTLEVIKGSFYSDPNYTEKSDLALRRYSILYYYP